MIKNVNKSKVFYCHPRFLEESINDFLKKMSVEPYLISMSAWKGDSICVVILYLDEEEIKDEEQST